MKSCDHPRLLKAQSHHLSQEAAIHEAGHATAIYLSNQQKQLPPIVFQIFILRDSHNISNGWRTQMRGGRLIHTLPTCFTKKSKSFSTILKQTYQLAFEIDIVNLLVGPLAEAKYVALRDDEPINPRLIPIQALHYYGGAANLELIHQYLDCFITDENERAGKITELFLLAYRFINNPANWQAIVALADYIRQADKYRIDHEEAGTIISTHLLHSPLYQR